MRFFGASQYVMAMNMTQVSACYISQAARTFVPHPRISATCTALPCRLRPGPCLTPPTHRSRPAAHVPDGEPAILGALALLGQPASPGPGHPAVSAAGCQGNQTLMPAPAVLCTLRRCTCANALAPFQPLSQHLSATTLIFPSCLFCSCSSPCSSSRACLPVAGATSSSWWAGCLKGGGACHAYSAHARDCPPATRVLH